MKIDAHQHFWRYNAQRDAWITDEMSMLKRDYLPGELLREMAANDMDACIAVQADSSESETLFLLELAAQHSAIAGVVGWVDLCSPDLPERLEYFSRFEKLRGFRHVAQAEPDDRFLLREDFSRGISSLQEFGFTYDILVYPRQLPAAVALARQFPEQQFVMDHMGKPAIGTREIASWTTQIEALAENPNVYCKLSGLVTEADWRSWHAEDFRPFLDVVFQAFGADRLMFGSDWPVCLLAATYRQVKQLIVDYTSTLDGGDKDKIFGLNAARFYGLEAGAEWT
ncbi:MAG: amidohydrolase family protein [Candidatus Acidiferrales bacterium]